MPARMSAVRRALAALAASCAAVLLAVVLAPTAASAVPGPESGLGGTLYWEVVDAAGARVPGAAFTVGSENGGNPSSWTDGLTTIADCAAACSSGDRDPDGGELQVVAFGSGNRSFRVTPVSAPAGYEFVSAAPLVTQPSNSWDGTRDLGDIVVRRTGPVSWPAATCAAGTAYAVSSTGAVRSVSSGGTSAGFGGWSGLAGDVNALGISADGETMYALQRSGDQVVQILRYRMTDGFQRLPGTAWDPPGTGTIVAGAVGHDGRYYFGVTGAATGTVAFAIHRFDPETSAFSTVGTIDTGVVSSSGSNGDLAFDAAGNLVLVSASGSSVTTYAVPAASVAASTGGALPATASGPHTLGALTGVNGVAFTPDGSVVLGDDASAARFDPLTFAQLDAAPLSIGGSSTDLASCGTPPSLTIRKDVVGRAQAGDQFRLELRTADGAARRTATTAGDALGVQAATIATAPVRAGQTYTVRELMGSGAAIDAAAYGASLACTGAAPSGSGASQAVTIPATTGATGAQVVCTFTNTPLVTTVIVRKDVVDASGEAPQARAGWAVTASASATAGAVTQAPAASPSGQQTGTDGAARWTVRHSTAASVASIAVGEVQQPGFALVSASCTVTAPGGATSTVAFASAAGGSVPGVAAGSTVDCRFVNRAMPTTLTLATEAIGGADASSWTLGAAGPAGSLAGPSGTTGASAAVTPGVAYALSATGGPATYAPELVAGEAWRCADAAGGAVAATGSSVVVPEGASVTCTIVHSTAQVVLLQRVEGGGSLQPADFQLTATPTAGTPALPTATRTGADALAEASAVEVRPGRAYELSAASDALHVPLRLERYTGAVGAAGELDERAWEAVASPTAVVDARGTGIYRFVAAAPLPLVLPLTGGLGADAYRIGGLALLLLAAGTLAVRARRGRRIREPQTSASPQTPASPQEGTATMATISTRRAARLAAGVGAVAIATVAVLGAAAPASAASTIDADPAATGSIVVHAFEQPAADGSIGTGEALDAAAVDGLDAIPGVEYTVSRVAGLDPRDDGFWELVPTLTASGLTDPASPYALDALPPQTTGATGETAFTGLPLGLYVVQQSGAPAATPGAPAVVIPAEPFLVVLPQALEATSDWLYDVHVYPKSTTSLATIEASDADHQVVGTRIGWTIGTRAPKATQGTDLEAYAVTTELDPRVALVDGSLAVALGSTTLVEGVDYTIAAPAAGEPGGTLTVTFLEPGLQALIASPGAAVAVVYETTVQALGDGRLVGDAAVSVNGATVPAAAGTDAWGAVELFKHDGTTPDGALPGRGLAGAVFELRDADGVPLLQEGTTEPIRYTTDADGFIRIPGLRTDGTTALEYQLVEIEAPAGYLLPAAEADRVHAFQVATGSSDAIEVTVENEQAPAYALPVTGGDGQAMFLIGGAGLLLLALGVALVRRRRTADQQA